MQVVIIGLGRMGKNICLHLLEQGVSVIAYNRSRADTDEVVKKGAIGVYTISEIPEKWNLIRHSEAQPKNLAEGATNNNARARSFANAWDDNKNTPLTILLFVPAGKTVDEILKELTGILPQGAIIIDGGNSFYKDSQRRYSELKTQGIHFLDMGTSGGLEGARNGACLMVGGDKAIFEQVRPVLEKISTKDGLGYFGSTGSGHFVKMVHNAIEYGMMGAIGEGFNLVKRLASSGQRLENEKSQFDLAKLSSVWSHGSIVSGLLMDKAASAFAKDPTLKEIAGEVPVGVTEKEMEWLETLGLPMSVISAARKERVATRTKPSFIGKVIAALRREFGGHPVRTVER